MPNTVSAGLAAEEGGKGIGQGIEMQWREPATRRK